MWRERFAFTFGRVKYDVWVESRITPLVGATWGYPAYDKGWKRAPKDAWTKAREFESNMELYRLWFREKPRPDDDTDDQDEYDHEQYDYEMEDSDDILD